MKEIDKCLAALVHAVETSEEYERYRNIRSRIAESPQKMERLNEFRKRNFLLQNSRDVVDLYGETERLEKEYADVYRDPLTSEYLAAELALCRMIQHINRELTECLDFETAL